MVHNIEEGGLSGPGARYRCRWVIWAWGRGRQHHLNMGHGTEAGNVVLKAPASKKAGKKPWMWPVYSKQQSCYI